MTQHVFYILCMKRPLPSFGSNQVDLGGITMALSDTLIISSIITGYSANAIFMSSLDLCDKVGKWPCPAEVLETRVPPWVSNAQEA